MRGRKVMHCMRCNSSWGDNDEYDAESEMLANKFEETVDSSNIRYWKLKRK